MLSWLAPIIVFGLVVFVHELGHFIAAKLTGVYAPRFSIGFGPSLLKKRFGETEYVLAALPLGGYVRMASREDEATAFLEGGSENSAITPGTAKDGFDPNAMIPFGPKPIPESRWFESKSLPARLFIMLAGVTMNALLAYAIYVGLLLHSGIPTPVPVAAVVNPGKPAALAGIQAGDSIASLNGRPLKSWQTLLDSIGASAGRPLSLGIVRKGQPVTVTVTPESEAVTDPKTRSYAEAGSRTWAGQSQSRRSRSRQHKAESRLCCCSSRSSASTSPSSISCRFPYSMEGRSSSTSPRRSREARSAPARANASSRVVC